MSPWGPVAAALIAGLIAYVGLITNKENETSKFRQSWIDSFRDDVAKLTQLIAEIPLLKGNSDKIAELATASNFKEIMAYINEYNEKCAEFMRLRNVILLRINSNKSKRTPEEEVLKNKLEAIVEPLQIIDMDTQELIKDIASNTGIILKNEWDKIKNGGDSYNISITLTLWLFSILSTLSLIYLVFHFNSFYNYMTN